MNIEIGYRKITLTLTIEITEDLSPAIFVRSSRGCCPALRLWYSMHDFRDFG